MGEEDKKSDLLKALFEDDSKDGLNFIIEKIIGSAYKISNALGCGFLEEVYENVLAFEIRKLNLKVEQQVEIDVFYEGFKVGHYKPDLLVADIIVVELKSVKNLDDAHKAQCLNYLKATGFKICLLINFGNPRVEVKRFIL